MELALWEWGQGLVAEPVFAPVMKSRDTLSLVPPAGMAGAMVGVEGVAFEGVARRVGSGTATISHPANKKWTCSRRKPGICMKFSSRSTTGQMTWRRNNYINGLDYLVRS
jgi:hypothetical protein